MTKSKEKKGLVVRADQLEIGDYAEVLTYPDGEKLPQLHSIGLGVLVGIVNSRFRAEYGSILFLFQPKGSKGMATVRLPVDWPVQIRAWSPHRELADRPEPGETSQSHKWRKKENLLDNTYPYKEMNLVRSDDAPVGTLQPWNR